MKPKKPGNKNMHTPIDKVIEFINSFTQCEYEATVACHKERNDAIFEEHIDRLQKFRSPGLAPLGPSRGWGQMSDEEWALWFKQGDDIIQRPLFQVKVYKHPKQGIIYRGYLGLGTKGPTMYDQSVYIIKKASGYRIISFDSACPFCFSSGCVECKGDGWKYFDGAKINIYTKKPIEIHKIQAPTWPEYLADYKKD